MNLITRHAEVPCLFATLAVAVLLAGLLVGYEPTGGDPDTLYRPLKSELARALKEGRLPFWSDRFGLGVPLVAESQVAAFYPANLVFYRFMDVSAAYRCSMWLHYLALVATTYVYARKLRLTPWGSAVAALAFTLCGFQSIHAIHEPFYHLMPYLVFALFLTELYVQSGQVAWLALLALVLGTQWTLGHFQIQSWTNSLVVLTGFWRIWADHHPRRRAAGLFLAVAWGCTVAAIQLVPSLELARDLGHTHRSLQDMAFFSFPPEGWIEPAMPWFFQGLRDGGDSSFFRSRQTTGYEAMFYIGTIPLILAFAGILASGRNHGGATGLWKLVVPVSFALATMPRWWPGGYAALLQLPGLGYFRAPARYTLLTSLGLALLAGNAVDRASSAGRFRAGIALAGAFGLAALRFGFVLASQPGFQSTLGPAGLPFGVATALLSWSVALLAVSLWRAALVGPWLLALITTAELGALYFLGPTNWKWAIPLPDRSPILSALAADPGVGPVGGVIDNLPVQAGLSTGSPYLGMTLSPLNQMLRSLQERTARHDLEAELWQRRLGVTHSIWDEEIAFGTNETVEARDDPALDALAHRPAGYPARRLWRVVHHRDAFPDIRIARHARVVSDWRTLRDYLGRHDNRDEAWFYPDDAPAEGPTPRARSAQIARWDGLAGVVRHDGACDMIFLRAFHRGWLARVADNPEVPLRRVDGGLQAVRIDHSGETRVSLRYAPPSHSPAAFVSAVALSIALASAGGALVRNARNR